MRRLFLSFLVLMLSAPASAQTAHRHSMAPADTHAAHMNGTAATKPVQPGQGAFAAIQEIVEILEADPKTDWSKVDIEALRQHLIDMNSVTLASGVATTAVDGGMQYVVTGTGPVVASIRRMIAAHAATMNAVDDWTFQAGESAGGAVLTVKVPVKDLIKLRGLGFLGVMTHGMHHQQHHLMIARGDHPHP
jgi:hypothetical protein